MFGCVKRLFPLDISSKGLLGQNSFAVCVCVYVWGLGGDRGHLFPCLVLVPVNMCIVDAGSLMGFLLEKKEEQCVPSHEPLRDVTQVIENLCTSISPFVPLKAQSS